MRMVITDRCLNRGCSSLSGFGLALLAACSCFLLSAGQVFAQVSPPAGPTGIRDFIEYWSASRLFFFGGNPYSPAALMAVQQMVGWNGAAPLMMWNPPWTLLFTLPFGLLNFTAAQFLWLLFHVVLILVSAQQLWRIYGDAAPASPWPRVLALTFIPTIFVLVIGQITPLILAGLTLWLYSEREQKRWAMGVSLLILSIKPHLLLLFWIVVALWVWEKRQWRMIFRAVLIGICAMLVPFLFNPNIYAQYFALHEAREVWQPLDWPAPTLRNFIKIVLNVDQSWLQLAPTVVAVLWAIYHWHRHKQNWSWAEQLPPLVLVSVTSSFFVWTYDHVVVLPALFEGAIWLRRRPAPWHRSWAARVYIAINIFHGLSRFWLAEELWYVWLGPALLANYLIFRWEKATRGGAPGDLGDAKSC